MQRMNLYDVLRQLKNKNPKKSFYHFLRDRLLKLPGSAKKEDEL